MDRTPAAATDPHATVVRLGPVVMDPHAIIYSTIMLMTAYALYDEGTEVLNLTKWVELTMVGVAPLFAISMAHTFSDALDLQIRAERRLTMRDRRSLLAKNLQYLYIAVPPAILIGVLTVFHFDANDAVGIMFLTALATLFFWGSYAARKAHLHPARQVWFGASYLMMGLVVLLIELAITH